jgi:hypothetical protein
MPQTTPRRVIVALILIIILATVVRTYGLRSLVFYNTDEAHFSYFVTRVAGLSPLAHNPADNAIATLLSWDYGWPLYTFDYFYLHTLEALRIPIYEATLSLTNGIFGILGTLLIYLLGTRFGGSFGRRRPIHIDGHFIGLTAAALFATMPVLVSFSRSMGGSESGSGTLFLLAALQMVRYYEQPERRGRAWLAGLCLGLYLCADVQVAIGGTILFLFTFLWPRPAGYEGFSGWRRLVIRWATLLPPLLLLAPYVPVYLYAIKLGYPEQTYLGTMLAEHKPDLGFHLSEFLHDLGLNVGFLPLFLLPLAAVTLRRRADDGRLRWLLCWVGLAALPFIVAVTQQVTEVTGYHEHVAAGLALLLAVALAALPVPSARVALATLAVAGALFYTSAGLLRFEPLVSYWPDQKIPYGGLPPNNGMKTAGYWVRQNVSPADKVFSAHDPAISRWYLGRQALIGGYGSGMERAPSFLRVKDSVNVAVIPDQQDQYPPSLFAENGFPGRIIIRSGGREIANIYTRRPIRQTLDTEQTDPLFTRAYHTAKVLVPPGSPYAPAKDVRRQ